MKIDGVVAAIMALGRAMTKTDDSEAFEAFLRSAAAR